MNYLGHLLLAEPSDHGALGAILGDFVKGPLRGQFPLEIERGIALHRAVDSFTDSHVAVIACRGRVAPPLRRYAGILVDLYFDHFLARHWSTYGSESIDMAVERLYRVLSAQMRWLPPRLQAVAPFIVGNDWLRGYHDTATIARALTGIGKRLARPAPLAQGMDQFQQRYAAIEHDFHCFMPDALDFARQRQRALS